jgi:hypothetical protein
MSADRPHGLTALVMAAIVSAATAAALAAGGAILSGGADAALILAIAVFLTGLFVALVHALVLGGPLYYALASRLPLTLGAALAASVTVATVPIGALMVANLEGAPDWPALFFPLAGLALSGAAGGFIFWQLMRD